MHADRSGGGSRVPLAAAGTAARLIRPIIRGLLVKREAVSHVCGLVANTNAVGPIKGAFPTKTGMMTK